MLIHNNPKYDSFARSDTYVIRLYFQSHFFLTVDNSDIAGFQPYYIFLFYLIKYKLSSTEIFFKRWNLKPFTIFWNHLLYNEPIKNNISEQMLVHDLIFSNNTSSFGLCFISCSVFLMSPASNSRVCSTVEPSPYALNHRIALRCLLPHVEASCVGFVIKITSFHYPFWPDPNFMEMYIVDKNNQSTFNNRERKELYLNQTKGYSLEASFSDNGVTASEKQGFQHSFMSCQNKEHQISQGYILSRFQKERKIPACTWWVSVALPPGKGVLSEESRHQCPRKGGYFLTQTFFASDQWNFFFNN